MTLWRRYRRRLVRLLKLAFRRQKQITTFVAQLFKLRGIQAWKLLTLNVGSVLLMAHPHHKATSLFYFFSLTGHFS